MPDPTPDTVELFGVRFNAVNFKDAIDLLSSSVEQRPAKVVVTPNDKCNC